MVDSSQALRAVSESLRALIRANIPEFEPESAVVFDSPAEIDSRGETRLALYLYKLDLNPYLRNLPPALTRAAGASGRPLALAVEPAPMVVDLLYMMVVYGRSAELELVLNNKLSRLFGGARALAGPWLHPLLRDSNNSGIQVVPDTVPIATLHSIWTSFPGKPYKLTLLYTVSPVRIPAPQQMESNMVVEEALHAQQLLAGPGEAAT